MVALIIIAVIAAIAVVVFLLRKYVPGLKPEEKHDEKSASKEHIDNLIVKEDNLAEKERIEKEKARERKKQIKQIKKESLNEEEENRRIAEIEKQDYLENADSQDNDEEI